MLLKVHSGMAMITISFPRSYDDLVTSVRDAPASLVIVLDVIQLFGLSSCAIQGTTVFSCLGPWTSAG